MYGETLASKKTGTNRNKLSKVSSKLLITKPKKRQEDVELENLVKDFYCRDGNSTTMPGKRGSKKVESKRIQKRNLNDYLRNLYYKFLSEYSSSVISFAKFARLRPAYCALANFTNRNTCLCTYHQNIALKLKTLKQTKIFETENPDVFIKSKSDEDIEKQLTTIKDTTVSYSVWRKVFVEKKLKNGQTKQIRKMKVIEEKSSRAEFISSFKNEIKSFQQHVRRVNTQYSQQRFLKEHLKCGQVAIHMDVSKDYNCRSQDEVQSAYWNNISVTLHPVVVYYRNNLDEDLAVKSYVIASNESRHDARFVH